MIVLFLWKWVIKIIYLAQVKFMVYCLTLQHRPMLNPIYE